MIITAPPKSKTTRVSEDSIRLGIACFTTPKGTRLELDYGRTAIFNYYDGKGDRSYCHTVHPDVHGNYLSWTYVPMVSPDRFGNYGLRTAWRIGKHATRGSAKKMALSYFTEENDVPSLENATATT